MAETVEKLMTERGWEKGYVFFGFDGSESSVRVLTSLELLKSQGKIKEYTKVTLNFDAKPLNSKGNSMGVSSKVWLLLSDGRGFMPALAHDGVLQFEAGEIVKSLAEKFPDESLSEDERKEVLRLLDFANENSERCLEALKHWGWQAFNGDKPNYKAFGYAKPPKQTLEWEKATVAHVDKFFKELDKVLAEKAGSKSHFVGDKLTLADCSLINWAWSFVYIPVLDVAKRYPNVMAQAKALKAEGVEGSKDFYFYFPIFSNLVGVANWINRGFLFGRDFRIENPKYWED